MKPAGVLLTIVCATVALAATVMIGRYKVPTAATPETPGTPAVSDEEAGPKIAPSGPYPRVELAEKEFDFGTMITGTKGSHVFTIKNVGEAPLELVARKEDTSCQCTFGEISREGPIAPGESVDVTVNWEIKVLAGEFRHRATIRTNDPEQRKIDLAISGTIDESIVVKPGYNWEFGDLSSTEPTTMSGTIFSGIHDKFEIVSSAFTSPHLQAVWRPMTAEELAGVKAKSGYEVTVTVNPSIPIGAMGETATLELSCEEKKKVELKLSGKRPGPIEFYGPNFRPERTLIQLGEFQASAGKEATLFIGIRDFEGDLELTKFESPNQGVEAKLVKDPKSKSEKPRYLLKVKVLPGEPADHRGRQFQTINLFFNHPAAPEVQLRLDYLTT